MASATEEDFKWPGRPKRHIRNKTVILADNAKLFPRLERHVVAQQATAVGVAISLLRTQFSLGSFGNGSRCPDLAMRMGVAGAHHRAAILKNLHMVHARIRAEFLVLCGPGANDLRDFRRLHGSQSKIVARRKTHHA